MFDFIAIDFETANTNMNSACSIGIVAMKNGIEADEFYSLIKPKRGKPGRCKQDGRFYRREQPTVRQKHSLYGGYEH